LELVSIVSPRRSSVPIEIISAFISSIATR
jgi:hypothetical protein